ncbi:hypothetical protein [Streptomyces sp. NPDC004682]
MTVQNGPEYIYDGDTFHTETPKTHYQVARMALEFASTYIDGE